MVNTKEIPPEAILLGVYLELQNGQLFIQHPSVISCCLSRGEAGSGFSSVGHLKVNFKVVLQSKV